MHSTTPTTDHHHGSDLPALRSLGYLHCRRIYRTWLRPYEDAAPRGQFFGYLAQLQLELGGYFVNEQPEPSWLRD